MTERTQINRTASTAIWLLSLGYFSFYIFYSALTKALAEGSLHSDGAPISGFALLPTTCLAIAITVPLIITGLGWWRHARRRRILGFDLPCPGLWTGLSGVGTALIIATTTLAYTFEGISIVFALLLMRAGVLILAPLMDTLFRRRVHWYSWTALAICLGAITVALAHSGDYLLSVAAVVNLALYLGGYVLRLQSMTRVAKSDPPDIARGYFVEEQLVSMPLLVIGPALLALIGPGEMASSLRDGFTTFLASEMAAPALLIEIGRASCRERV